MNDEFLPPLWLAGLFLFFLLAAPAYLVFRFPSRKRTLLAAFFIQWMLLILYSITFPALGDARVLDGVVILFGWMPVIFYLTILYLLKFTFLWLRKLYLKKRAIKTA